MALARSATRWTVPLAVCGTQSSHWLSAIACAASAPHRSPCRHLRLGARQVSSMATPSMRPMFLYNSHSMFSGTSQLSAESAAHGFEAIEPKEEGGQQDTTWNAKLYQATLTTAKFGQLLLHAPTCPSTQDVMLQMCSSLPSGTVVVADCQEESHGRGRNVWSSPHGQLAFSVMVSLDSTAHMVFMQYLISLCMAQAVYQVVGQPLPGYGSGLAVDSAQWPVRLKWPNDIYANNMKIGGVLCNSVYNMAAKRYDVICGIGLNVFNTQPTTCLADIFPCARNKLSIESLLATFLNGLESDLAHFASQGFDPFKSDYYNLWLHSGQRLSLDDGLTSINVQGLSESGYLCGSDSKGQLYELHPDGNSLDLFQGLVKKKLN